MSLMALSPPSISQTPRVFQPPPAILTLELEIILPPCRHDPPFRQKNLTDSPSGPRLNRLKNNHRLCHISGDFWDTIGWPSFIWRDNLWGWLDWGDFGGWRGLIWCSRGRLLIFLASWSVWVVVGSWLGCGFVALWSCIYLSSFL